MQRVLVTGAEGFVGSRLVKRLSRGGYEVIAAVRNRARKLAYERDGQHALVCEITDAINVARVVASAQPNAVIHLAGITSSSLAEGEPLLGYQSIPSSCAHVLDAVRRAAPRAHVVLASSSDVYGNAGADGTPLSEQTPTKPVTTYGSLKRLAEDVASTFYRDYHLNVTIARPFQYTGAEQSNRVFWGAVAERLAAWDPATHGEVLALPDLSCRRDVMHVDDVVEAYVHILEHGLPNQTYNICSGEAHAVRDLVQEMAVAAGRQITLDELPVSEDDVRIDSLCGSNAKLCELAGWSPKRKAIDAVQELVRGCVTGAATAIV